MSGSYYATMLTKDLNNNVITGCGSFENICIDGRLSFDNAVQVAKENFQREAGQDQYIGFAIEKTSKAWQYKNPAMIDTKVKANDVGFLI